MTWAPLLWLAATLAVLLLVERWIHRHLQGVMLLLAGDPQIAVVLYALPLLPGVILHELSHALAARLLGARVGRLSIRPKLKGRHIRLGSVPVERTGVARSSLIGLAPLLLGSAAILLIGRYAFDVRAVVAVPAPITWAGTATSLLQLFDTPDAWIWAYVIFAVSNTMLPSRSDRRSWGPVTLFLLLAGAVVWVAGFGPVVIRGVSAPLNVGIHWLATMYALTIALDLPFAVLIALAEKILERLRSVTVTY